MAALILDEKWGVMSWLNKLFAFEKCSRLLWRYLGLITPATTDGPPITLRPWLEGPTSKVRLTLIKSAAKRHLGLFYNLTDRLVLRSIASTLISSKLRNMDLVMPFNSWKLFLLYASYQIGRCSSVVMFTISIQLSRLGFISPSM